MYNIYIYIYICTYVYIIGQDEAARRAVAQAGGQAGPGQPCRGRRAVARAAGI